MKNLITPKKMVEIFNKNIKTDDEFDYLFSPFTAFDWHHLYSLKSPAYIREGKAVIEVNEWDEILPLNPANVPMLSQLIVYDYVNKNQHYVSFFAMFLNELMAKEFITPIQKSEIDDYILNVSFPFSQAER